jgi:7-carboxy-7-deazaguanine synthase
MQISELFYSIQGEGLLAGLPSFFVRTSGCNLRCRWCDTPYTSWRPEGSAICVDEIVRAVRKHDTQHVVVTGGEPMISPDIKSLTEILAGEGYHITVETAGTVFEDISCSLASISPKLSNSTPWKEEGGKFADRHESLRDNASVVQSFMDRYPYQLKFVIDTADDMVEIEALLAQLHNVDRSRVLLMPQSVSKEQFAEKSHWIAELCLQHGFRFGTRIHLDLYGNTRGT